MARESNKRLSATLICCFSLWLGGCAVLDQDRNVALIREPGAATYARPFTNVRDIAQTMWPYAAMAENAYFDSAVTRPPPDSVSRQADNHCGNQDATIPLPKWHSWPFLQPKTKNEARERGLFVEAWINRESRPHVIVVAFRGTQFSSWRDVMSNLNGLLRWIPGYQDQYTHTASDVVRDFADAFATEHAKGGFGSTLPVLITTGHSLGAGLATQFAYALPRATAESPLPRVSHVFAFDPSPVTGWYSVDSELRLENAAQLNIDRVFEHGEALSFVRLLTSYVVPPSRSAPAIRQIRFNFNNSWNPASNHKMRLIACNLWEFAHPGLKIGP